MILILLLLTAHYRVQADINDITNIYILAEVEMIPETNKMIDAKHALELALQFASGEIDTNKITDIIVESADSRYTVTLVGLITVDKSFVDALKIDINADNGKVLNREKVNIDNPMQKIAKNLRQKKIISGVEAYKEAINAIKGYEHYDKFGRLEIRLDIDHYKITFPEVDTKDGGRTADFTYQVWIDFLSKKVVKILAPS